ncbi:TPA: AraC family transcriptional regulator, partial [Pseudomonas aeruginosa]|nr:AraC family transcriptional regulator [Pseudomonas aeruginosa]
MERRRFSAALQGQNLRFTGAGEGGSARARVGFLLLEHFSLPAFTQALDTLVTANLIRSESFAVSNFSLSGEPVTSDLGLLICPDLALASAARQGLDLLVVCGGLRTPLRSSAALREALQDVASRGVALAGLWNGAWFLGDAGLLDGYRCCIHPEHRAALAEIARNSQVTSDSYMVDRDRLTAASPTGAFNLALEWIARRHGRDLVEAVVDILAFEESRYRRVRPALHEKMSEPLREVINLMAANI